MHLLCVQSSLLELLFMCAIRFWFILSPWMCSLLLPLWVKCQGCNIWILAAQKHQWVVWIHLSFPVLLQPLKRWRTCLLKKMDLWKDTDMSASCKSRPTSGRHLSMCCVWSPLRHADIHVFVATCPRSSFFSCVSYVYINTYSVIYPYMFAATLWRCND